MEIQNASERAMVDATNRPRTQRPARTLSESDSAPRPLRAILDDLQKSIPERLLETKTIQGRPITYCPWYRVQKILDHYTDGLWEYEVVERTFTQTHIMLTVRIYIHAAEGIFYREGTGIEHLDVESFGDPQSNAESQAFRRACARWGLGLHLYDE